MNVRIPGQGAPVMPLGDHCEWYQGSFVATATLEQVFSILLPGRGEVVAGLRRELMTYWQFAADQEWGEGERESVGALAGRATRLGVLELCAGKVSDQLVELLADAWSELIYWFVSRAALADELAQAAGSDAIEPRFLAAAAQEAPAQPTLNPGGSLAARPLFAPGQSGAAQPAGNPVASRRFAGVGVEASSRAQAAQASAHFEFAAYLRWYRLCVEAADPELLLWIAEPSRLREVTSALHRFLGFWNLQHRAWKIEEIATLAGVVGEETTTAAAVAVDGREGGAKAARAWGGLVTWCLVREIATFELDCAGDACVVEAALIEQAEKVWESQKHAAQPAPASQERPSQ